MAWFDCAFSLAFDRTLGFISGPRRCSLVRSPDDIDGICYTIDDFIRAHREVFEDPCTFFKTFRSLSEVSFRSGVHPSDLRKSSIDCERFVFDSPLPSQWAENQTVPFEMFRGDRRAPSDTILLVVPGWGGNDQKFEEGFCRSLHARGIDVGLTTVPLHQARTPKGASSGEYWISENIFLTIANFRLMTAELRLLIQFLRQQYRRVGLVGISSGGFLAALASNCESVDFFFPIITGAEFGKITWQSRLTKRIRRALEARKVSEFDLSRAWSVIDEYALGRHCKAKHVTQFISLYDEIVPTEYQYSLFNVLSELRPQKVELPSGHYSVYFHLNRIVKEIAVAVGV